MIRKGNKNDLKSLKLLGLKSWSQYRGRLSDEHWHTLRSSLANENTYTQLLSQGDCLVYENKEGKIVGMAFLIPRGNPTDIYDTSWCHLRFVSVDPDARGQRIAEQLTNKCIQLARENNEQIMALHTSEIMDAARHIYEKIGFEVKKELPYRLGIKYWLYTFDLNK